MSRIPSDHATVTSHPLAIDQVGRTSRLQVPLDPVAPLELTPGAVLSLSLSGTQRYAQLTQTLAGAPALRSAFQTRRLARVEEPTTEDNRLTDWINGADLVAGNRVVFDVLAAGHAYGLRVPGERVVYDPPARPDPDLSDIAEKFG
ncbi:MAG: hypothetical protein J07HX5_01684 [halophilic archaeon J07HX5]|nr:MAG: hypothetical protein J07HX5_01684 [halophilic archaeon J07HX5]